MKVLSVAAENNVDCPVYGLCFVPKPSFILPFASFFLVAPFTDVDLLRGLDLIIASTKPKAGPNT